MSKLLWRDFLSLDEANTIMSSNLSSTTLHRWRERSPSSFSIKVENFSQLESSTLFSNGNYRSYYFSSGDYNWRMIIYPKGNDKDNGSGFISMYVEIESKSLLSTPQPHEVYADIRFFIFNKKENKYFTIEDVESKIFNTFRTINGLPQVLPLDTFNDHKNGYIFNGDHCEFGVDIIVAPPPTSWEILSFDEKLPHHKFSWTVKHFFAFIGSPYESNSFSIGGKKWFLRLYPKGSSSPDGTKWLSIFLMLAKDETFKEDEKIYVQAILKVEDPFGSNHLTRTIKNLFDKSGCGYGCSKFVSIAELRESYLDMEDTLKVEVEFEVVSSTKYNSFT